MDIPAALSMLGQASSLAKTLMAIDKSFDLAKVKAQMAEIYGALADAKIALADAREEIHSRDQSIQELRARITAITAGEACPLCDAGHLKVASQRPHSDFGHAGLQERTLKCDTCNHSEMRLHDPDNVLKSR